MGVNARPAVKAENNAHSVGTVQYEGKTIRNAICMQGVWHFFDPRISDLRPFPDQSKVKVLTRNA